MKKLLKCKSFKEIYDCIGEEGFENGFFYLICILMLLPVVSGIFFFIGNVFYGITNPSYQVVFRLSNYNYDCMAVYNLFFYPITFLYGIYVLGRIGKMGSFKNALLYVKEKEPWLLFWLAFVVWGFCATLTSYNVLESFIGSRNQAAGFFMLVYTLCIMGCAHLLTRVHLERVFMLFCISACFCAVVFLAYEYDIPVLKDFATYYRQSVFTNSNYYGYFIAIASVFFAGMFFMTQKLFYIISYALHIYVLVINDTMGAYLAVFFGLIMLMILWSVKTGSVSPRIFVPIVLFVFITFLGCMELIPCNNIGSIRKSLLKLLEDIGLVAKMENGYEKAGSSRIALWIKGLKALVKSPVFGYGPDMLINRKGEQYLQVCVHNEFIETALYTGIPGLILYMGGIIFLLKERLRRLKELSPIMIISGCVVATYLFSSFFGMRFYNITFYMYFFVGLTMLNGGENEPMQ